MAGINCGILTNAYPLSTARVKELEKQVLENQEAFAYLDESSKLCFSMPQGVDGIKDIAWHNAYELSTNEDGTVIKKVYNKTGLKTFEQASSLAKANINSDLWYMNGSPDVANYNVGTIADSIIVADGCCTTSMLIGIVVDKRKKIPEGSIIEVIIGDTAVICSLDGVPTDNTTTVIGTYQGESITIGPWPIDRKTGFHKPTIVAPINTTSITWKYPVAEET
jgi:hypothetical protein